MDWLIDRHRKAIWTAIDAELEALAGGDEAMLAGVDETLLDMLGGTLLEWLLAEGRIDKKGKMIRLSDFVLLPGGPPLYPDQRAWLEAMTQQPLRLYRMGELDILGQTVKLHDVLDATIAPHVVQADLNLPPGASASEIEGQHFLTRVLRANGRCAISLPYLFLENIDEAALADILQRMERVPADARATELSFILRQLWIEQFFGDWDEDDEDIDDDGIGAVPEIIQATTGEPVMLVTERYHVKDRDALDQILEKQRDVLGDREHGFSRVIRSPDEATPRGHRERRQAARHGRTVQYDAAPCGRGTSVVRGAGGRAGDVRITRDDLPAFPAVRQQWVWQPAGKAGQSVVVALTVLTGRAWRGSTRR